jgi:hypothetical protein
VGGNQLEDWSALADQTVVFMTLTTINLRCHNRTDRCHNELIPKKIQPIRHGNP